MNNTPLDSIDYNNVKDALEKLRQTTRLINEEKRKADSLSRIMKIQDKVRNKGKVKTFQLLFLLLSFQNCTNLDEFFSVKAACYW